MSYVLDGVKEKRKKRWRGRVRRRDAVIVEMERQEGGNGGEEGRGGEMLERGEKEKGD